MDRQTEKQTDKMDRETDRRIYILNDNLCKILNIFHTSQQHHNDYNNNNNSNNN